MQGLQAYCMCWHKISNFYICILSRSRSSFDDTGSVDDSASSYHGKRSGSSCCCTGTDCSSSSCAYSMQSYDRGAPASAASTISSSVRSSVSNAHSDPRSKDSGISASSRHKEKHNVTVVTYWFWGEPIPYRTSIPGKSITLKQFKTLISRVGQFRYASFQKLPIIFSCSWQSYSLQIAYSPKHFWEGWEL